jgi:hypothetical protein
MKTELEFLEELLIIKRNGFNWKNLINSRIEELKDAFESNGGEGK